MSEVRISIDPFKDAGDESKLVVEALRPILPLKSERIRLLVKVPAQYAAQSFGALKGAGEITKEEWGSDGGITVIIEIPAGAHSKLLDRLGSLSKGTAQATIML